MYYVTLMKDNDIEVISLKYIQHYPNIKKEIKHKLFKSPSYGEAMREAFNYTFSQNGRQHP